MKASFINHILTSEHVSQQKVLSFKPGQIITGNISKLFPDNIAALQIGGQKIVAQLEAPLEAGKSYWFQVLPGEGKPRLRVLVNAADSRQNDTPHTMLLKQLSLPATEENKSFIRFLIKEQLPVNKEIFQLAGELPRASKLTAVEEEAVKLLVMKQLPLTKTSFQAVRSVLSNESFSQLLEALSNHLLQSSPTAAGKKLLIFIENMYKQISAGSRLYDQQVPSTNVNANKTFADRSMFVQYIKEMMGQVGVGYEQDLVKFLKHPQEGQDMNRDSLKPLLIDFLQENPVGKVRETAETMLNKITGMQLLGADSGPIQQFALQVPMMFGQKAVDLTMQWSGKKQENGKIDPAYCRVLFYIELEYLQETIVDMQVQNRVIRLLVINEQEQLKSFAAPFIDELKENLQRMNFTLSAVQFTRPANEASSQSRQHGAAIFDKGHYTGVDIRI